MSVTRPLWLVGLSLIPLIWWIHRHGIGAVSDRQRLAASVVRSVIVASLVLALAGASMLLPERKLATAFVIDRSDSIAGSAESGSEEFVQEALDAKPGDALAGVVVAGAEARVETSVQQEPRFGPVATDPDGSRTDLARAMRLAAAILPEGTRRRVVVLSDGRENSGDARAEAARLRRQGIRTDTVALAAGSGPDAGVLSVKAPSKVRQGDRFDVEVEIFSNFEGSISLTVHRGAEVAHRQEVLTNRGRQTVAITETASSPGSIVYRAESHSDRDSIAQNDASSALVLVDGPPRVVMIEGESAEGEAVAKALSDRGFIVDRRGTSGFPHGTELASTDSVVLVDVDASSLTTTQMETLTGFVRGLGRGVVAIGGESSWSLGNYRETPLEDLLPVTSEIKDPKRRPSIAQALVIDVSGSMEGEKNTISKAAAARAAQALSGDDELGILAFNDSSKWVLPIQTLPSDEVVREGIAQLVATGGTNIPGAIRDAVKGFEGSKAALKHIVLFSDGFNGAGDMLSAAQAARDAGITLSVVGTGESAAQDLARIAETGGGRFYPGRDLQQIPEIVLNEVIIAARKYINEGTFFPKVTGSSAATDSLTSTPAVLGYIGTSAKPSTSVSLAVGEFDDPLLASWRTGLGVATAWTSDAKSRWSQQWIGWEGFADFWSNVVRETLPSDPVPGFSVRATTVEDGLDIAIESETAIPEGVTGKATIVDPQGRTSTVALERTGISEFGGSMPGGVPGAYLLTAELMEGGKSVFRDSVGAVRTFSSEYRPGPPDESLLKDVARATGGRFAIAPADAFRSDLPLGRRQIELGKWLLLLAAVLLPVDIALRRVILTKDDLRQIVPSRRRAEPVVVESLQRLFQVKERLKRSASHDRDAPEREPVLVPPVHAPSGSIPPPGISGDSEEPEVAAAERSAPSDPSPAEGESTAAALLALKRRREGR